jgi:prephenate dehydratase
MFYLDLTASLADESTQVALSELRQHASTVRILGCYVAAEMPAAA